MAYKSGDIVAVFVNGKTEIGSILKLTRENTSNSYYDILLERGTELNNIPGRPNKNSKMYINKKLSKKIKI